ncbi:AraC family transcriptional regulator [Streptomyces sp. NPDC089799]
MAFDDIGVAVGYASEFTFSRAFSRELGIAPRRYRRAARTQPAA